jgi:hypothetical protein
MYALIWKLIKIFWLIVLLVVSIKWITLNYDKIKTIPNLIKEQFTSIKLKIPQSVSTKSLIQKQIENNTTATSHSDLK